MKKLAFKMYLNEGMKNEYIKRHEQIWPELRETLKQSGISEYHIFFDDESSTLFAFQVAEEGKSSQELGENEIVKKWWAYMKDIMPTNPDNSPVMVELEKVFTL